MTINFYEKKGRRTSFKHDTLNGRQRDSQFKIIFILTTSPPIPSILSLFFLPRCPLWVGIRYYNRYYLRNIKKERKNTNTKDDIIAAISMGGMHIQAKINDTVRKHNFQNKRRHYKIKMQRVEAGYHCPWHHYLFINLCEKYIFKIT
jgi:hypothetical protein